MVNEPAFLAALVYNRDSYEAVQQYVSVEELSAQGSAIFSEVQKYYSNDPEAKYVDKTVLLSRLSRKFPNQKDLFRALVEDMTPDGGTTNVVRELLEVKRRAAGEKLAIAIGGAREPAEVLPLLDVYRAITESSDLLSTEGEIQLLDTSYGDLVRESKDEQNLIKLLPNSLNTALRGGVLPGHTVVIIGRVNVGKSALAVHNIAGFLQQGKKVLLIENEDLPSDVKRRVGLRLCRCTLDHAEALPEEFDKACRKRGGDNLYLPDPVPTTVREIDKLAARLKPDVIVVNQLRHLATQKAAEADNTGAVDRVVQQLRALGKREKYLMVLVGAAIEGERTQSGFVKEKATLEMSDAYGSRTGVPGCADVLLAIGSNSMLKSNGQVCIKMAKNKRGGDEPVIFPKVNLENCVFSE